MKIGDDVEIALGPNGFIGILIFLFALLMFSIGFSFLLRAGENNMKFVQNRMPTGKDY